MGVTKDKFHGLLKTPLYNSWRGMKQRCYDKSQYKNSKNYQDNKIVVCSSWQEFIPFKNWALKNGYKKSLTIDRINNNGNYEPKNCRWITRSENSRLRNLQYDYSKRKPQLKTRFITLTDGQNISVKEYCEKRGIVHNTFRRSLKDKTRFIKEEDLDSSIHTLGGIIISTTE